MKQIKQPKCKYCWDKKYATVLLEEGVVRLPCARCQTIPEKAEPESNNMKQEEVLEEEIRKLYEAIYDKKILFTFSGFYGEVNFLLSQREEEAYERGFEAASRQKRIAQKMYLEVKKELREKIQANTSGAFDSEYGLVISIEDILYLLDGKNNEETQKI